ncbi:hypothetical protein IAD21_04508 [Abditibacteriota bacterium]|nr:hypothetical protein IAD21_04508 [Abditibacteriota bacterium]
MSMRRLSINPVFIALLVVVAIITCLRDSHAADRAVTILTGNSGLASLQYEGTEFLSNGEFHIDNVVLRRWDGKSTNADVSSQITWDAAKHRITRTYSWGTASCLYAVQGERLDLTVDVHNTSDSIIDAVDLQLMEMKFPQAPQGWVQHYPYLSDNRGTPTAISAVFNQETMVVCNEEVGRPLLVGFPGRESLTVRPLTISSSAPANIFGGPSPSGAVSERPIYPGGSDSYHLSLRFGPGGASVSGLASDVLARFATAYPPTMPNWTDRRPIGSLHLSTSEKEYHSPTNPRGWFSDPKTVDITTPQGRESFAKRLSDYADTSIKVLKDNNAQGMIVWDLEGQEYPHATSYLGDPRSLPAEIEPLADQFFAKFKAAGLRTGLTIRPQMPVRAAYGNEVSQVEFPDIAHNLMQKIDYAHKRWGCTLFYVDSNVNFDGRRAGNDGNAYRLMDASIFQEVAAAFPDVLLIPEHENTRYYAYTAPYNELRQNVTGTPDSVTAVYPRAFGVIYVPDGPIDQKRDELIAAVKHGDILMFRGWWPDDYNAKVKSIYEAAKK